MKVLIVQLSPVSVTSRVLGPKFFTEENLKCIKYKLNQPLKH